jgi:C4-dicarboxylate-specific signal transduction histidine kinase
VAAFDLPYNTPGNVGEIVAQWHNKKFHTEYWDQEAYTAFAGNLVKQGVYTSTEQYLSKLPDGGFYLHFAPFLQGMLYVGNTAQLGDQEIRTIQSVADAFSTAYARYEDFSKLEAAKLQVDNTLFDLKKTQKQLIQAEKMASLGQLTAGIAHEIQNPLNFINNFSEVNTELIMEMKEEITKGNFEAVRVLADNVKENEEKITYHGKRAESIVKGMLQHTRNRKGRKEPTNINALCDEYLRLSYHGLRARDKGFNAGMQTSLDASIGSINVVPQEIGSVLLNLFNNAFYAVNEKKQKLNGTFEPVVTVVTKKENEKVVIRVIDNGFGIPQSSVDKIFQPFYTTKPAGQGTGLGLSLSYDVIKAHDGTIKVETKENEGTVMVVELPV